MSDTKRIQLTTITDVKKISDQSSISTSKTVRIELNLFEPNADSYPEFNYLKLLHAEKKKRKKESKTNGFVEENDEENDADVQRIAKEFERKYGGANNYVKKTSRPTLECNDKGAGYDDNDSFIDNTEAYDEIIPDEIETVGGGFYINSGALEFKHLSNFERPEDAQKMPKPKKRILSTSSESTEDDEAEVESDPTNGSQKNGHIEKKQKIVTSSDDQKNPKIIKTNKIITDCKEKKIDKLRKEKRDDATNSDSGKERDKQIKTTTVKDMLRAKRDNLLSLKEGGVKLDVSDEGEVMDDVEKDSSSSSAFSDSSDDGTDQSDSDAIKTEEGTNGPNDQIDLTQPRDIKLPNNLSEELIQGINLLKEASQTAANVGKCSFFDTKISEILLKVELGSRLLGSAIRNQVYSYLEQYLPCTKQTLLTRAKKLRIHQEELKIKQAFSKLKISVDEILPNVLLNYQEEYKKVLELRASQANSDDKCESNQQIKSPRKRFPWNENLRILLYELYIIRRTAYNIVKPRKENLDEYLDNYLKSTVVNIWPSGWMRVEDLSKEIEKRKSGSKKPKENKKPNETTSNQIITNKDKQSTISTTSIDAISSNNNSGTNTIIIGKQATQICQLKDNPKSILSANNSVVKTEKHINSIKTEKSEQYSGVKKNSGNGNSTSSSYNSSLTITPVTSTSVTTKPLTNVQNKVTISNIDTTITSNTSNLSSSISNLIKNDSTKLLKQQSTINQQCNSNKISSAKIPSSLSISLTTSLSSIGNPHGNSGNKIITTNIITNTINTATTTTSQKQPITQIVTKKERKTSDYSINSIMSTTPTSPILLTNNNLTSSQQQQHSNFTTTKSSNTNLEIINNNTNKNQHIKKINTNFKEGTIKVRSVANMNNSIHRSSTTNKQSSKSVTNKQSTTKNLLNNNLENIKTNKIKRNNSDSECDDNDIDDDNNNDDEDDDMNDDDVNDDDDVDDNDDLSDSSDGVEIVGVFPTNQKEITRTITVNKIKYTNVTAPLTSHHLPPPTSIQQQQLKQTSDEQQTKTTKSLINVNQQQSQKLKKKDDDLSSSNNSSSSNSNSYNSTSNNNKNSSAATSATSVVLNPTTTENELDVNQIMKELKELQELQQHKYTNIQQLEFLSKSNQHSSGRKDQSDSNNVFLHKHRIDTTSPTLLDRSLSITPIIRNYSNYPTTINKSCDVSAINEAFTTSNLHYSGILHRIPVSSTANSESSTRPSS